jgi:hypothetical protein
LLSIAETRATGVTRKQRGTGTLGAEYRATAPRDQKCQFPTRRGLACGNPANYWVDDLWSCSRDHRGNTWSSTAIRPAAGRASRSTVENGTSDVQNGAPATATPLISAAGLRAAEVDIGSDWLEPLAPDAPVSSRLLPTGVAVPVVRMEFIPWSGPPLGMAEDCNKRGGRVTGKADDLSCAEVEIVRRLRRAGWDAYWVSAFRCGEQRWGAYRLAPSTLPVQVRDLEARVGVGDNGRPDVVAWTGQRVLYLESKGPTDRLRSGQIAWMTAMLGAGRGTAHVAIVSWTFAPTTSPGR